LWKSENRFGRADKIGKIVHKNGSTLAAIEAAERAFDALLYSKAIVLSTGQAPYVNRQVQINCRLHNRCFTEE
jgi:hypothetical protein